MMRKYVYQTVLILAVLMVFFAMPAAYAAGIAGSVYKDDGVTQVTDATIIVTVYTGMPCGYSEIVAQQPTGSGSYHITGLSAGVYYLKAEKIAGAPDYTPEWWAAEASIWDCQGGQTVTISSPEEERSGMDFQLDLYGSISGTFYDAYGNLIDNVFKGVVAFRGTTCDNSKYINAQVTERSADYTIPKIPPGTYYVVSDNRGDSWHVDEYHTVSGNTNNGVSYFCDDAVPVFVGSGTAVNNIDFQLDIGGRISGTVFKSDGITPITDADIRVFVYGGDVCETRFVNGTKTSSGMYTLDGLPAGSFFLQAFRESGANYTSEWFNQPFSSPACSEAEPVSVWLAAETGGKDFQLDSGGTLTGRLVDESGLPIGNLTVECENSEVPGGWFQAVSDPVDGTFAIYGLGSGRAEIIIMSDPGRYLAGYRRNFYMGADEQKDIGTLTVRKGAEICGMVTRAGIPVPDVDMAAGAKLSMSEVETDPDGKFSMILPPGEFILYSEQNDDAVAPQIVTVTEGHIGNLITMPPFSFYDLANGEIYSGTVTINDSPPAGTGILTISFVNHQSFDLDKWAGVNPVSFGGVFSAPGTATPYQLAVPVGSTIRLMTILLGEGPDRNEFATLIESYNDLAGGGSYDFTYTGSGSSVDGYITRDGQPVFLARVALYNATTNDFAGFAETDHTGHYGLYNVPDGTYRLVATAEDLDCLVEKTGISVTGNMTVAPIELGSCAGIKGDFTGDRDVDGADLIVFAGELNSTGCGSPSVCVGDFDGNGQVDASDLELFALNYGGID